MNNTVSSQAQKGFKTFVVTLSVSLALFGVLYYFLNKTSSQISIEDNSLSYDQSQVVLGSETETIAEPAPVEKTETVFGALSSQKVDVPARAVLAGATQSTQSTTPVPNTGSVEITYAIFFSSILIGAATFMYLNGTRKTAIASFEKDVLKSLDKDK